MENLSNNPGSNIRDPFRVIRVELVISGVVLLLATVGIVALSFAYWRVQNDRDKIQSITSINERQQEIIDAIHRLRIQNDVLKSQNVRSIEDRDNLHESQGATRQSLNRLEKNVDFLRAVVEQAIAKERDRQKAREAKK